MSSCIFSGSSFNKMSIDEELDMILGISPLPMDVKEEPLEMVGGENLFARKNSLISESQETHHNDLRSESNFNQESSNDQKKSNHHNFQKHTFTALKDLVKEQNFENYCEEEQNL